MHLMQLSSSSYSSYACKRSRSFVFGIVTVDWTQLGDADTLNNLSLSLAVTAVIAAASHTQIERERETLSDVPFSFQFPLLPVVMRRDDMGLKVHKMCLVLLHFLSHTGIASSRTCIPHVLY